MLVTAPVKDLFGFLWRTATLLDDGDDLSAWPLREPFVEPTVGEPLR